jgi:hypothetical protein
MGRVSQWARMEAPSAEPAAGAGAPAARGLAPARRVPFGRDERIVLGSIDAGAHVFQRITREAVVGSAAFLVPAMVVNLVLSTVLFDRFESLADSVVSVPELIGGVDAATAASSLSPRVSCSSAPGTQPAPAGSCAARPTATCVACCACRRPRRSPSSIGSRRTR